MSELEYSNNSWYLISLDSNQSLVDKFPLYKVIDSTGSSLYIHNAYTYVSSIEGDEHHGVIHPQIHAQTTSSMTWNSMIERVYTEPMPSLDNMGQNNGKKRNTLFDMTPYVDFKFNSGQDNNLALPVWIQFTDTDNLEYYKKNDEANTSTVDTDNLFKHSGWYCIAKPGNAHYFIDATIQQIWKPLDNPNTTSTYWEICGHNELSAVNGDVVWVQINNAAVIGTYKKEDVVGEFYHYDIYTDEGEGEIYFRSEAQYTTVPAFLKLNMAVTDKPYMGVRLVYLGDRYYQILNWEPNPSTSWWRASEVNTTNQEFVPGSVSGNEGYDAYFDCKIRIIHHTQETYKIEVYKYDDDSELLGYFKYTDNKFKYVGDEGEASVFYVTEGLSWAAANDAAVGTYKKEDVVGAVRTYHYDIYTDEGEGEIYFRSEAQFTTIPAMLELNMAVTNKPRMGVLLAYLGDGYYQIRVRETSEVENPGFRTSEVNTTNQEIVPGGISGNEGYDAYFDCKIRIIRHTLDTYKIEVYKWDGTYNHDSYALLGYVKYDTDKFKYGDEGDASVFNVTLFSDRVIS